MQILIIFICLQVTYSISHFPTTYSWNARFKSGNSLSSSLLPYHRGFLLIDIISNPINNNPQSIMQQMNYFGIFPYVQIISPGNYDSIDQSSISFDPHFGWILPFSSTSPGLFFLQIGSSNNMVQNHIVMNSTLMMGIGSLLINYNTVILSISYCELYLGNILNPSIAPLLPPTSSFSTFFRYYDGIISIPLSYNSFLFSNDNFQSYSIRQLSSTLFSYSPFLCSHNFSLIITNSQVYAISPNGLLLGNFNPTLSWNQLFPYCVEFMSIPSQISPFLDDPPLIFVSSFSLFIYTNNVLKPLLDSNSQYFNQTLISSGFSLSNIKILSIDSSIFYPMTYYILLQSFSSFYLYRYDQGYVMIYEFPPTLNYYGLSSNSSLYLYSLSFSTVLSNYLYVWGNVLLFSSDFGQSYLLLFYPASPIISFTSSINGQIAFLTSNNQVYFGNIHKIVLVDTSSLSPSHPSFLYFDILGHLYQLSLEENTPIIQLLETSISNTLSSFFSIPCPYLYVSFSPLSIYYTRSSSLSSQQFPSEIFIDYMQTLSFFINFTLSSSISVNDFQISSYLFPFHFVSFSRKILILNSHYISVEVSLIDNGLSRHSTVSGDKLSLISLDMTVVPSSLTCNRIWSYGHQHISIYSGCPPYYRLFFLKEKNVRSYQFSDEFLPTFYIYDSLTHSSVPYYGYYNLKAIAGGSTLDSIQNYSSDEIIAYNLGISSIWSYNFPLNYQDDSILLHTDHYINWFCAYGSPCESIIPLHLTDIPHYYLRFEVTTFNSNSYCHHTTQFTILIEGIYMNSFQRIYIFLFSTLIVFIIFLGVYGCFYREYNEYKHVLEKIKIKATIDSND